LPSTPPEPQLRQRLGIPIDAARVLIFSESSHWDTNLRQLEVQGGALRVAMTGTIATLRLLTD
jgi:hypothetical protein